MRDERPGITLTTRTALGVAALAMTAQLAGCGSIGGEHGEGEGGEGEGGEGHSGHHSQGVAQEVGQGTGEGEGAVTAGAEFATDDAAYLTQLGLIRGHLRVGYQLYVEGLPALSETHMKHPRAEIYSSVAPAFAARGCPGFGEQLTALSTAVAARAARGDVTAAYNELVAGIAACEAGASTGDPAVVAKVIENLLRTAGVEYQVGVIDGEIDNLHEYQDAWGFTQVADSWARSAAFASPAKATAVAAQVQGIINELRPLWPNLNPEEGLDGKAAALFGAAGKVEVAALALSR